MLFALLLTAAHAAWPAADAYDETTWPTAARSIEFSCDDCVTDEHIYATPNPSPESSVVWRDQVAVFLVGTGGSPSEYGFILDTAAYAGFHAVVVSWPTEHVFTDVCDWPETAQDGLDCLEEYDLHLRRGQAGMPEGGWRWTEELDIATDDSVEGRIEEALGALAHTGNGWDAYVRPDGVAWDSVVVGGFSQGANHARRLAQAHEVAGAVYLDGGVSFFHMDADPNHPGLICTARNEGVICAPRWELGATPEVRSTGIYDAARDDWYETLVASVWADHGVGGRDIRAVSADVDSPSGSRLYTHQCQDNPLARTHNALAMETWIPTDAACDTAAVYPEDAGQFYLFPAMLHVFRAAGAPSALPVATSPTPDIDPIPAGCDVTGSAPVAGWFVALIAGLARRRVRST